MKPFMKVSDIFAADDGAAVLAGCDSTLDDLDASSIRRRVGSHIIAKSPLSGASRILQVVDLEVSSSLVGKKNVFLKLVLPAAEVQEFKDGELFTEGGS